MHIIAKKALTEFAKKHPDAKAPLERWWSVCRKNSFASLAGLKRTFGSADIVLNCLIFNIGGGKYRLVPRVNFTAHRLWIKYILPHKAYEKLNLREDEKCQWQGKQNTRVFIR